MPIFNFRSRDFGVARSYKAKPAEREFCDTEPNDMTRAADEDVWLNSSFDLRRGLEVSEQALDTLPGELRDAFVKP